MVTLQSMLRPLTKSKFIFHLFIIVLGFSFYQCQRRVIKKNEVFHLNEYYKNKNYYLKENLTISSKEILEKGTLVKIWIESTPTILKLKCFPSNIDREIAIGKMVTYLVNDDIRGSDFTLESIEELIDNKLTYYDPKEVTKAKTGKK
jgi:type II secretion system-associated lipoprotein